MRTLPKVPIKKNFLSLKNVSADLDQGLMLGFQNLPYSPHVYVKSGNYRFDGQPELGKPKVFDSSLVSQGYLVYFPGVSLKEAQEIGENIGKTNIWSRDISCAAGGLKAVNRASGINIVLKGADGVQYQKHLPSQVFRAALFNGFVDTEGNKVETQILRTSETEEINVFFDTMKKREDELYGAYKVVYGSLGVIGAALPFCIFAALI